MIERYEDSEDAIPHETTVLVLNETDTCFDEPESNVLDEVRSELSCDKLLVEGHFRTLDELPDYDTLIQYEIWVVHHSCLLVDRQTPLSSYLRNESFPDETKVIVVIDVEDGNLADHVKAEYSDDVTVVASKTALKYFLLGHLETASPCTVAGLQYLQAWNNKVADTIGPHQEID